MSVVSSVQVDPKVQHYSLSNEIGGKGGSDIDTDDVLSWFKRSDKPVFHQYSDDVDTLTDSTSHANLTLTYADLAEEAEQTPSSLTGERVLCVFPPEQAATLATCIIGLLHRKCLVCPLDPNLSKHAMVDAVTQLKCTSAVVSPDLPKKHRKALGKHAKMYIASPSDAPGRLEWRVKSSGSDSDGNGSSASHSDDGGSNDSHDVSGPGIFLRTSGTTGTPKIVPISMDSLYHNAHCIAASLRLTSSDVTLNCMPLYHIGGIMCNLLSVMVSASSVCFPGRFDPATFIEALEDAQPRATWYYAAPTIHKALIMYISTERASSMPHTELRLIRSGAAHLNHDDAVNLRNIFGCTVMPTYSMSECMPVCSVASDFNLRSARDTVGQPIGPSVRICDGQGRTLPYGQVGEVCIMGPGVIDGYVRSPSSNDHHTSDSSTVGDTASSLSASDTVDGTSTTLASSASSSDSSSDHSDSSSSLDRGDGDHYTIDGDAWLRTGDMGRMDRHGQIYLQGRLREMAKRGGEQVSLHEVDEAVRHHHQVQTCVAFSVPNDFWGEEIAVAVVLKPNVYFSTHLAESIRHKAGNYLEDYKVPHQVICVSNPAILPRGPTGKYLRRQFATALNVKATDNSAVTHASGRLRPSKALYGMRFILACCVAQHHIGRLHFEAWAKIQNVTMNMTGFMMLGGFLLSASTTREISRAERPNFYATRIGAMHPLYLFSIFYAIPAFLIYCNPGNNSACPEILHDTTVWTILLIVSIALHLFCVQVPPLPIFNGPTWFQAAYYSLVLLFPFFDNWMRRLTNKALKIWLGAFTAAATIVLFMLVPIPGGLAFNFNATSWIPCFATGMALWHLYRRNRSVLQPASNRRMWAIITDGMSVLFALILVAVVLIEDQDYTTYDEFDRRSDDPRGDIDGRYGSTLGLMWGFLRGNTPFMALWIYGLATGEGITAWLFSRNFLVKYLSPLAYALYLLHGPTSLYFWYIYSGETDSFWLNRALAYPVPVPAWGLLIVVVWSLLLGYLFNEYLNPHLVGPLIRAFRRCTLLCCNCACCFLSYKGIPEDERDSSLAALIDVGSGGEGTLSIVQKTIRRMTGADVIESTQLDQIGLDSFGATALCGALRSAMPDAKHIRPVHIYKARTVGGLVARLDAIAELE